MRVVIDAVPLLVRSAGVKNYLYYWIAHLRRAAGSATITTFPAMDAAGPLLHDSSVAGRWTTASGLAQLAASNYLRIPILDSAARNADIFHASNLVRYPPRRPRLTATVYDMTPSLMPELHHPANRRADQSFGDVMRRAHGLIAISECTKSDALRMLGIAPEKIVVIHPGIADAFFDVTAEAIDSVRRRYRLTRPFALFIGTIEPRKNLSILFDAFEALPQSVRDEFELVIAGPVGWAPPETTARLEKVRYLGYIPEADIAPLTAAAAVFVYPSLYEGFGFPVAQALAAGVPVVTSAISSLPEVTGDAALLVDPRSATELREAIRRLLLSPVCAPSLPHAAGIERNNSDGRRVPRNLCNSSQT